MKPHIVFAHGCWFILRGKEPSVLYRLASLRRPQYMDSALTGAQFFDLKVRAGIRRRELDSKWREDYRRIQAERQAAFAAARPAAK